MEEEHRIALVDDHHMMRSGLAAMIDRLGGYHVVIEAANGKEMIEAMTESAPVAIAIVDLHMPVMDGYETIAWLKANAPDVLPLALTFDASDDAMLRAVRAGARGFLLKNARPPLLKAALDSLVWTGYFQSDELHRDLLERADLKAREERERENLLERITPREMEFLLLVCSEDEFTYEEIAIRMEVHRRSVDNFRISLFEKFQIKSKTGLVLFAMRWGLIGG